MAKIMEIIEKETRGKSYHTYKYSYDSIGLPTIDYDDDPNKIEEIRWKMGRKSVVFWSVRPFMTGIQSVSGEGIITARQIRTLRLCT